MRKLLDRDHLEQIVKYPEKVDVKELMDICHQIFAIQAVVGLFSFVPMAFNRTLGLDTIFSVAFPAIGFWYTRQVQADNYHVIRWTSGYWFCGLAFRLLCFFSSPELSALPGLAIRSLVGVLQWMAMARLWRCLQDRQMREVQFYLNLVFQNVEAAVAKGVQNKLGWGDKVGTRHLGKLAGKIAGGFVSQDKVAANIATKLEDRVPEQLKENGITASCSKQYQRGNVLVLLVKVEAVNIHKIIEGKGGKEKADEANRWIRRCPKRMQQELSHFFMTKIASSLLEKLPENLANNMKEFAGVDVLVEAKTPAEEAPFLFALLAHMERTSGDQH
eukprot:gnl/MRDRNA2_/MRDRNA2_69519_c0_seq1.p1 gnl/MRDRNA2_/MRDRNA2_69519_c0~~gnl/MRDRNA2_/MRDRNA2_69519_c0_seq1.p1  ORF type:complete len:331 (-),score=55.52 gnl/MRDRNA2_/MRDRNA2_69519_c0_seq1:31-1023(-)